MNITKIKKLAVLAFAAFVAVPASAQDLLAKQAPVDRRMKAVDSMVLKRIIAQEEKYNPSADLYEDWNNVYAHRETTLPDSFRIDLRGFHMPTDSRVVTSNFGSRWGRQHKGLDIKVYIGDTIRAAFSGKIRIVKYEPKGYGKYVVIRHHNGLETIYGHMSKHLVVENQEVKAGEPIGLGGNTGRSTGSHLHFETRLCGVALNPALMFDFRNQDVVDDYYVFRKSTYQKESAAATRLRGAGGITFDSTDMTEDEVELATAAPAASYAQETRFHKVKKGETLYSIATHRGTTVDAIMKLNHLKKNAKLKVGQILKFN
jgi:murein DD-endopeptidase MepM/ murein hydrolase activator NlpD